MDDILTDAYYLGKQIDTAKKAIWNGERFIACEALRRASDALERIVESQSQPQAVLTIWGDMEGL